MTRQIQLGRLVILDASRLDVVPVPANFEDSLNCVQCGAARPEWACCSPWCTIQLVQSTPMECACDTCAGFKWWGSSASGLAP